MLADCCCSLVRDAPVAEYKPKLFDVSSYVHCKSDAARHRKYSFCSFLTSALDWGEWSASRPGRTLPPGKGPPVPTGQEAGWTPEPVLTQKQEEKSFASAQDLTPVVQSEDRHNAD
jgi:hypothetical protein